MNPRIDLKNVSRVYSDANGTPFTALHDVSLSVEKGEFVSIIGPSGCGKTTLLRLVAGLDLPQAGTVSLDGEQIKGPSYERGYVFQHVNLFPWLTVQENISSGLKARGIFKSRKDDVPAFIKLAGLEGFEKSYPHQISGGMAQRASLARALINDPKVLLLDEPLGALDSFTRFALQDIILELWEQRGATMLFVTHDVDEAIYLSDRIVIMTPRPGEVSEIVEVKLARPRLRNDAMFFALRSSIMEKLHLVGSRRQPEYFL
ncbi:MAG: ABC transporter ATP-binding protein [Clostridiales bacterium]|jgi:ABC-type nitrate/sulfonate/bicarbonate transport system ATPase subunit|nr:ABC transporter ATP-binding protein [Clostridiales bacterium]